MSEQEKPPIQLAPGLNELTLRTPGQQAVTLTVACPSNLPKLSTFDVVVPYALTGAFILLLMVVLLIMRHRAEIPAPQPVDSWIPERDDEEDE